MKKKKSKSEDDESDEEGKVRKVGAAKSIHSYVQHGKDLFKDARGNVKKYVDECMEELGVEQGQPWLMTDVTRKIHYGDKFRNLHRMDWMLRHVLKVQLSEKPMEAALQTVLCLR